MPLGGVTFITSTSMPSYSSAPTSRIVVVRSANKALRSTTVAKCALAVATVAAVALIAGAYFFRPAIKPAITTITLGDGANQWTGDGGRISEMSKPFDILAKGPISMQSRGERIRTFDPLLPKQYITQPQVTKYA